MNTAFEFNIKTIDTASSKANKAIIVQDASELETLTTGHMLDYAKSKFETGKLLHLNLFEYQLFIFQPAKSKSIDLKYEDIRQKGNELWKLVNQEKISNLEISSTSTDHKDILALTEGFLLSAYQFEKYKTKKKEQFLKEIIVIGKQNTDGIKEIENIAKATYFSRTLVNEPVLTLTAERLAEEISKVGKEAGFSVEVLNLSKIKSLKMGGILAVNKGSIDPPTFSILEYKGLKATNKAPIVLVGKGVVYDTGGLSLKPTPNSMDYMKTDMAGAAVVAATIYALALNNVPVHVIGLIPATDNRPGGNAITPGDVITSYSGKTIEILNTDAEGRLILADALSYASKFNPELVIDIATLTGSAARAIGKEGIVFMGTASEEIKKQLTGSGNAVHERLVEFPLWDEYHKMIESDIADLKNIGGEDAGAITAGKFLEVFTDYPWMHLDIAGPAFIKAVDSYRGKNATGMGVRLLYHFLKNNN